MRATLTAGMRSSRHWPSAKKVWGMVAWRRSSSSETSVTSAKSAPTSTWQTEWRTMTSVWSSPRESRLRQKFPIWATTPGRASRSVTMTHLTSRSMQTPTRDYSSETEGIERSSTWTPTLTLQNKTESALARRLNAKSTLKLSSLTTRREERIDEVQAP